MTGLSLSPWAVVIVASNVFISNEESCKEFRPVYQLLTEIVKLMKVFVDVGIDLMVVIRSGASRYLSAIEDAI